MGSPSRLVTIPQTCRIGLIGTNIQVVAYETSAGNNKRNPPTIAAKDASVLRISHMVPAYPSNAPGRGSGLWHQLIADEGEPLPVRRPRRHVHRSLPAEQLRQHGDLFVLQRHPAEDHIIILRMAFHARVIR